MVVGHGPLLPDGPTAPAEDPMLEGYTTLGFLAAHTSHRRARPARHRRDLPPSRPAGQDRHHARRAVRRPGRPRHRRRLVRARAPRPRRAFPPIAERFERLEETLQICLQMWDPDDDGPFEGKHYQLAETLCSPQPLRPRPRIMIGGGGETEDPAARRAVRRRLQPVRHVARGRRAQARRAAPALRRRSAATTTRSARPSSPSTRGRRWTRATNSCAAWPHTPLSVCNRSS